MTTAQRARAARNVDDSESLWTKSYDGPLGSVTARVETYDRSYLSLAFEGPDGDGFTLRCAPRPVRRETRDEVIARAERIAMTLVGNTQAT